MRLRMAALGFALLASGCSKSSVELLKAGDSKVCANSDVTDQLFTIVRQNTPRPMNEANVADFNELAKKWADKIKLSVDGVTSKDVDAPNQKIVCNATIHVAAAGIDGDRSAVTDYQVTTDLSTSGKVIVSADVSSATSAMMQTLYALEEAEPEVKEVLQKREAAKAADFAAYMARHNAETAAATAANAENMKNFATPNYPHPASAGSFTAAENASIQDEEDANEKCKDGGKDQDCNQQQALYFKLKGQGICWGPEDVSEAEKRWMRCPH